MGIGVAILGCGTVGSEVVRLLQRMSRSGGGSVRISLVGVAVRHRGKRRPASVPRNLVTDRPLKLIADPRVKIVVELIGGTRAASVLCREALIQGKALVTANKALLDSEGDRLFALAGRHGVPIAFEGSVGGGIPIIRSLAEGLVANRIQRIRGIINGTTNYILSTMASRGSNFADALREAQRLGFAEANPRLDIEGIDAAQKLAILIRLAFGRGVSSGAIATRGIAGIQPIDIVCARRLGYCIKPLAVACRHRRGLEVRVHPAMIPLNNPLASVDGAMNAIGVMGDAVGEVIFYGEGAGGGPTASAVVGDILSVAERLSGGRQSYPALGVGETVSLLARGESSSEYYLRMTVTDRPGVLARITGILGAKGISISSVDQHGEGRGGVVPVIILTHKAREKDIESAVMAIDRLDVVRASSNLIRIESV